MYAAIIRISKFLCLVTQYIRRLFCFMGPARYSVKAYKIKFFAFTVFCDYEVLQYFATRMLGGTSRRSFLPRFEQSLGKISFEFHFIFVRIFNGFSFANFFLSLFAIILRWFIRICNRTYTELL